MSTDVSILGLGSMGSTLARVLLERGYSVSVWNRSPASAEAFAGRAQVSASAAEALASSPLALVCVTEYSDCAEILDPLLPDVEGTAICSLGSSAPSEARELAERMAAHGVPYLDGAIVAYPARIGGPDTLIYLSGEGAVFERHRDLFLALGGASVFLGEDPGAASVADLGWLNTLGGFLVGLLQGAAMVDAGGFPPEQLMRAVPSILIELGALAEDFEPMLASRRYAGDQARLSAYPPAFEFLAAAARETGVDDRFPELLRKLAAETVATGHGDDQFAAVFERLRNPGSGGSAA